MENNSSPLTEWEAECLHWWGRILIGKYAHWCYDFDGLPVDETTEEWAFCHCYTQKEIEDIANGVAR